MRALRTLVTRFRRRIETALCVLTTIFHLEQSGSHSFDGLVARTAARMLA